MIHGQVKRWSTGRDDTRAGGKFGHTIQYLGTGNKLPGKRVLVSIYGVTKQRIDFRDLMKGVE